MLAPNNQESAEFHGKQACRNQTTEENNSFNNNLILIFKMKKLFTTILMMTVALVTWGQDATETWQDWSGGTYKWDESSGTLTVKYTGGEFDLKDLD